MESETIMLLMDDIAVLMLLTSDLNDTGIKANVQSKLIDLRTYLESVL